MRVIEPEQIRGVLNYSEIIDCMRGALIAYSRGECEMPMPMHLAIQPEHAEIHIKSSYRRGGKYFALKIASTFPGNVARGLPTGNGMMLLCSAETGEPLAVLADEGHLTDVRTAAVAAMTARELGRADRVIGILGTGIQARLQACLHAKVLPLEKILIWGRNRDRAEACARDLAPIAATEVCESPGAVAAQARLLITATASRKPLLDDAWPGTHISAVGSDSPGKQELSRAIVRFALILVDSRRQCEKLGELQHSPETWDRAFEIGTFCESPVEWDRSRVTIADFTGLGVEDLAIAEYCYERIVA